MSNNFVAKIKKVTLKETKEKWSLIFWWFPCIIKVVYSLYNQMNLKKYIISITKKGIKMKWSKSWRSKRRKSWRKKGRGK